MKKIHKLLRKLISKLYQLIMIFKKKRNGIKHNILRIYQKIMKYKHIKFKPNLLVIIVIIILKYLIN
jgi:hypothetical protein